MLNANLVELQSSFLVITFCILFTSHNNFMISRILILYGIYTTKSKGHEFQIVLLREIHGTREICTVKTPYPKSRLYANFANVVNPCCEYSSDFASVFDVLALCQLFSGQGRSKTYSLEFLVQAHSQDLLALPLPLSSNFDLLPKLFRCP